MDDKKPTPKPEPLPPLEGLPGAPDWMLWFATACIILGIVIVIVILAGCAPLSPGSEAVSTIEPSTVQSVPMPAWAWPADEWLNMDWDLWSCPRAKGC